MMKDENRKIVDASKSGLGLLIDSLLDVGTNIGAEAVKKSVTSFAGEVTVDTVSSFIPGVSGAVSAYKRMQADRNMRLFIQLLYDKHEEIIQNLQQQTEDNRKKLDELLLFILEIVTEEHQEEKIEYMVNGYLYLTEHEEITSDFVMHYYDMLKQLRLVDISVLRLYFKSLYLNPNETNRETFEDVMSRHGITYEQYNSVRETLKRYGLLELEVKDDIDDDMSKLEEGINKIISYIEHINKNRKTRPPKIAKVKIRQKSKERIKLSKFGKGFYNFFVDYE